MNFEKINNDPKERDLEREETIRRLHDQKSGDFDPETGVVYDWDSQNFDKAVTFQVASESMDKVGSVNQAEQKIVSVIDSLEAIKLTPELAENTEQQKLLNQKLKTMKGLIEECLDYAVDYVQSIRLMSKVKLSDKDLSREDYIDELKTSDEARRLKHNALIDSLKIANRFLQNNFANMPQDKYEQFVATEKKSGRAVLEVERQDFGKNGLVSDNLNLNDRDQVKDWAILITDSLDQIKKELN